MVNIRCNRLPSDATTFYFCLLDYVKNYNISSTYGHVASFRMVKNIPKSSGHNKIQFLLYTYIYIYKHLTVYFYHLSLTGLLNRLICVQLKALDQRVDGGS